MLGFHDWMNARVRKSIRGSILDHETGEHVEVMTARAEVFLGHTSRRAAYNKERFSPLIVQLSSDQARADKNDPFARDRVRTHFEVGLCDLSDYGVDFQKVIIPVSKDGHLDNFTLTREIPHNMRRP